MNPCLERTGARPFPPSDSLKGGAVGAIEPARDVVHFVGVGGIGMSGLARIMVARGAEVSGSDMSQSTVTEGLERIGVPILLGHRREYLPGNATMVVRSAAVPDSNPEVAEAKSRGIPVLRYSKALGMSMEGRKGITVSGTHGKTTTTAMISKLLCDAGLDPTFLVGGLISEEKGNSRAGKGEHYVVEACEYAESFLDLKPRIAVVTNIESDHLDYYGTFKRIKKAFERFISMLPPDGLLVTNADDPECMSAAINAAQCRVETFGIEAPASVRPASLRERRGRYSFDVVAGGRTVRNLGLLVPGRHNVLNALAAAAVGLSVGASPEVIASSLSEFEGVKRRFEIVGRIADTTVVSDYAHHPTEIKAVLACARKTLPRRRIICVFEPHQGSRTRQLMTEFASAFAQADEVVLPDIYYVRDSADEASKVTSRDLEREISAAGTRAVYVPTYEGIVEYLRRNVRRGDVIIAMGAGTIERLPARIVAMLREKFATRRFEAAPRRFVPKLVEQIMARISRRDVDPLPRERMAHAT